MGETSNRAKEPASALLAGPYGHPFHPILVTVPIGAWISSLVFDVAAQFVREPTALATGARWLIGIGVLSALAAAAVGFLDFFMIPAGTRAHRVAFTHMVLNLSITVVFALDFLWRLTTVSPTSVGPLLLSVLGIAALGVSGSLGGKLAYRYGVRVVDEAAQAEGFLPIHASRPDSPVGSFVDEGD